MFEAYECTPVDDGRACAQQTVATCPSRCAVDTAIGNCRNPICADLRGASACGQGVDAAGDCAWRTDLFRCYDAGVAVPCSDYNDYLFDHERQAGCEAGGCAYDLATKFCSTKGERAPCAAFMDEVACLEAGGCRYFLGSRDPCVEEGAELACDGIWEPRLCSQQATCIYNSSARACQPCDGLACDATTSAGPTTTRAAQATKDPFRACATYTPVAGHCPSPCAFDFVDDTCRDAVCHDHITVAACKAPCVFLSSSSRGEQQW